jgi:hypothetical protein
LSGAVEVPASTETYAYSNGGLFIRTDPAPVLSTKVAFTLSVDGYKPFSGELEKA